MSKKIPVYLSVEEMEMIVIHIENGETASGDLEKKLVEKLSFYIEQEQE
jgi:hypothetical protein